MDGGRDLPMIASRYSDGDRADDNDDVLNDDDQEETSKFETCAKPQLTDWTNEKHSLYLKSIEASFVDQLYSTMGFPSFQASRKSATATETKPHLRSSVRTSAGQFKTLRGGHWQKINVGKNELQQNGENTSFAILSNPWIRHYIQSERHNVSPRKAADLELDINSRGKAALPHRFNRSLKISTAGSSNSHHHVSADNDTEASGQNFINEDIMEEKPSGQCGTRLVKTLAPLNDPSSNYQIDP